MPSFYAAPRLPGPGNVRLRAKRSGGVLRLRAAGLPSLALRSATEVLAGHLEGGQRLSQHVGHDALLVRDAPGDVGHLALQVAPAAQAVRQFPLRLCEL